MTDPNIREMLSSFKRSSEHDLCAFLEAQQNRFPNNHTLLSRYRKAYDICFDRGYSDLDQFMESHNEICVAVALLQGDDGKSVRLLEYEKPLIATDRRFDFFIRRNDDRHLWIEVKSIRPQRLDAWNKFTSVKDRGLLSGQTDLILSKDFLGGEIYHDWEAARSKMLEYSVQTEEKIKMADAEVRDDIFVLWFCMRSPRWNRSHLEDFVAFYRSGVYRYDDAFGKMQKHYLESKQIELDRSIHNFVLLERNDSEVRWRNIVWNVTPPKWQSGLS